MFDVVLTGLSDFGQVFIPQLTAPPLSHCLSEWRVQEEEDMHPGGGAVLSYPQAGEQCHEGGSGLLWHRALGPADHTITTQVSTIPGLVG